MESTKDHIKQVFLFIGVGVTNTIVDLAVLNFLLWSFKETGSWNFTLFKSISFFFAAVNSYILNNYFTFSHRAHSTIIFSKFLVITLLSFSVNVGIASVSYFLLVEKFGTEALLSGNVAALLGTAVALFINFFGYKFIVFKKK